MKYKYLLVTFLLGLLSQQALGQVTAWRPFQPGFIYTFAQAASPTTLHTLRVDSAYATAGGDSVYTFNRLMRHPSPTNNLYLKSRNNLFGARLRWQPNTKNYYLEANAEPSLGSPTTAVALLLKPHVAVGSTWTASSTPALTATLSSRTLSTVGSVSDSVATITFSNGQSVQVSRRYGLLTGPQWLTLSTNATPPLTWQQAALPQVGLGSYDPRQLLLLGAGDELGYEVGDTPSSAPPCRSGFRLRRILSRQQTADSLVFIYQEQDQITTVGWPGCGTSGTALGTVSRHRWAFSLHTGNSPQFPFLGLLTGAYRATNSASSFSFYIGQGYGQPATTNCMAAPTMTFAVVYGSTPSTPATPIYYGTGLDAAYVSYTFSAGLGVGPIQLQAGGYYNNLVYYRKGAIICGQANNFAALLPNRAAQAAAAATLHPNPAADAATLTLNEPAQPGSTLVLTDALGRQVWRTAIATNQTILPIPLASQPAGLYLVQLLTPGAAPLTWKLQH